MYDPNPWPKVIIWGQMLKLLYVSIIDVFVYSLKHTGQQKEKHVYDIHFTKGSMDILETIMKMLNVIVY